MQLIVFHLSFFSLACLFGWCSDKWSRISCMHRRAYARNNNVALKKRQWSDRNAFSLNIEHWTLVRMPNENFSSKLNKQQKTYTRFVPKPIRLKQFLSWFGKNSSSLERFMSDCRWNYLCRFDLFDVFGVENEDEEKKPIFDWFICFEMEKKIYKNS